MASSELTTNDLHRVAVHIVARARHQATGRFGLRVLPGGFGTPEFGDGPTRVRVTDGAIAIESTGSEGAQTRCTSLAGSSLRSLADFVGVDLTRELSVGTDTPPLGDIDESLTVDVDAAAAVADWWTLGSRAIDRVLLARGAEARPTVAQLWPEHFDLGLDVAVGSERVNLGASPGDSFHAGPYLYVGPWSADRPGDSAYWNAPFGAVIDAGQILAADVPVDAAVQFFTRGLTLLAESAK